MARTIDNTDDVIDSRDVVSRIAELQGERDDLKTALSEWEDENLDKLKELEDAAPLTYFVR